MQSLAKKADYQFSDKHYTNMAVSSAFQSVVVRDKLACFFFASNSKLLHFSCTKYALTLVDATNSEIERLFIMMNIKIK